VDMKLKAVFQPLSILKVERCNPCYH